VPSPGSSGDKKWGQSQFPSAEIDSDPVFLSRDALSLALIESRNVTLAWLGAFEAANRLNPAADRAHFDPPAWAVANVGWFQEYWIARNLRGGGWIRAGRRRGCRRSTQAPTTTSIRAKAAVPSAGSGPRPIWPRCACT
jgi:hypothetical protein